MAGLGIRCAAREALTLDELGIVAAWIGDAQRRVFVHAARELQGSGNSKPAVDNRANQLNPEHAPTKPQDNDK